MLDPITTSLVIGAVVLKVVAGGNKSKKEDDYDPPTEYHCARCKDTGSVRNYQGFNVPCPDCQDYDSRYF